MAEKYITATTAPLFWTAATNWNGSTLPSSVDDVYGNNKTVYITSDVTVSTIRTTTTPSTATAGGSFTLTGNGYTVTSNIIAGTTSGLNINLNNSSSVVNLIGGITAGTSGSAHGINMPSLGTINITGYSGLIQTGNIAHLLNNSSGGIINCTATTMTTSRLTNSFGSYINNTGGGTINLYATEIGAGDNSSAHAIINNYGNVTTSATTFSSGTGSSAFCLSSTQATSSLSANTNMYGTNFLHWSGVTVFISMNASGVVNAISDFTDRIPSVGTGGVTGTLFGTNTNAWVRINQTTNGTATTVNFVGSDIANNNGQPDLSTGARSGAFQFAGNNNCSLNITADSFSFNTSLVGDYISSTNVTAPNFSAGTINITGRNTDKVKVYYVNPNISLGGANLSNPSFINLTNACNLNAKLDNIYAVPGLILGTGSGNGIKVTNGIGNVICDNIIASTAATNSHVILLNGSGTLNITGSSFIMSSNTNSHFLFSNGGSGNLNITANTSAKVYRIPESPSSSGLLNNTSSGVINFIALGDGSLTGSVITNPYGNTTSTINNTSTGIINVTADTFYINSAVTTSNVYPINNSGSASLSNPTINAYFNKTYLISSSTVTTGTEMIRLGSTYGTINFTGTDIVGNNSSAGVINGSTNGTININCVNISGGGNSLAYGVINNSTGTINITASTILSSVSQGVRNVSTGILNVISQNIICGNGNGNAVHNNGGGTINLSGITFSFVSATTGNIINNAGAGTINVTGNTFLYGISGLTYGINNASTGRVNARFNTLPPPTNYSNHTIFNSSTGRIDLSASTISASSLPNTYTIYSITNGTLNITADTISSSNSTTAIYSQGGTANNNILFKDLVFVNGISPVYFVSNPTSKLITNTSQDSIIVMEDINNNYVEFATTGFTGNNSAILPTSGNVRNNLVYGYSAATTSLTGSTILPPSSAVTYGTLYDATTTGSSIISIFDFGQSLTTTGQTA